MKKQHAEILNEIRFNSRESFSKISKKLKIPLSTVHKSYNHLRENIIQKHTSIIRFENLPRIIIHIETNQPSKIISTLPKETNNIYQTNKGLLVEIIFKTLSQKYQFLRNIKEKYELHEVLEDLKREEMNIK